MNYGFYTNIPNQMPNYINFNNQIQLNQIPNSNLYHSPPKGQNLINQQQFNIYNPIKGNQINNIQKQTNQPSANLIQKNQNYQPIQNIRENNPNAQFKNFQGKIQNAQKDNIIAKNTNIPSKAQKLSNMGIDQNNFIYKNKQPVIKNQINIGINDKKNGNDQHLLNKQISEKNIQNFLAPSKPIINRYPSNPNLPSTNPTIIQKSEKVIPNQDLGNLKIPQNFQNNNLNQNNKIAEKKPQYIQEVKNICQNIPENKKNAVIIEENKLEVKKENKLSLKIEPSKNSNPYIPPPGTVIDNEPYFKKESLYSPMKEASHKDIQAPFNPLPIKVEQPLQIPQGNITDKTKVLSYKEIFEHNKQKMSMIKYTNEELTNSIQLFKEKMIGLTHNPIENDYKMERIIGKGSFGEVWEAIHRKSNEKRAIKLISKNILKKKKKVYQQIKTEFAVLKQLDHPNIMKIYEAYETLENIYIVSEFLSGGNLMEKVGKQIQNEIQVSSLLLQIIKALIYCHNKQVVHRDIKPDNIMFAENTPNSHIKLIDFGLSSYINPAHKFQEVLGSPMYMCPEIIDKKNYTEKCDIWSCGILTFILLTGKFPYNAKSAQELFEKVKKFEFSKEYFSNPYFNFLSDYSKEFLMAMLQKDPDKRKSAVELLNYPFLSKEKVKEKEIDKTQYVKLLENLKKYPKTTKLQKIIRVYLATNLRVSKRIKNLRPIFNALDKTGKGEISFANLESMSSQLMSTLCISKEDLLKIFKSIDVNKNGYVEYSEFLAAGLDLILINEDKNIEMVFDFLDSDRDGFVKSSDLAKLFKGDFGKMAIDAKSIMNELQCNPDDKISKKEFLTAVQRMIRRENTITVMNNDQEEEIFDF